MTTSIESGNSEENPEPKRRAAGWLKVATVAAASAVAGGVAAAWWHRKTLAKLRQPVENPSNPDFGISSEEPHDEA
jgi:hypothetical protein